jgi:biopolymer transport protein ExbD
MSAAAEPNTEPDLTPLLDLVLQLVMFFMLVVHFENELRNENVQLPRAGIAKGLVNHSDLVFVNVLPQFDETTQKLSLSKSLITVFVGTQMLEYTNQEQLKVYLKLVHERDQTQTPPDEWAKGNGRTTIVIRGDKSCTFRQIYDTMLTIREVGYTSVQMRVQVDRTTGS